MPVVCSRIFLESTEQVLRFACASILYSLISNDVSNLVQNQHHLVMRFIPYVIMVALILVVPFIMRKVEHYFPQDTGRPDPEVTRHSGRAGGNQEDQSPTSDHPSSRVVGNDPKLRNLFGYLANGRLEREIGDAPQLVENSAPASVSRDVIERSSQSQLGISNGGAVQSNSQAQPGSREGIKGNSSLARGPVRTTEELTLTMDTSEVVIDVKEAFQPEKERRGSRILYRTLEIGPQTGVVELDNARLQIIESMRRARAYDRDCTLQIGSSVVLKYTDSGPKWWKLEKDWTPIILDIHRSRCSLLAFLCGWNTHWTIRGVNLREATMTAATMDKCENLKILQQYKAKNGEDVFLCEEPDLVQCSAPMFQDKVYISASKVVEVDAGVTFNLQSEAKNVRKAYWLSVMEGLIPSPWILYIIASLTSLQGVRKRTHGSHHNIFSKDVSSDLFLRAGLEASSIILAIWRELLTFILVYVFTNAVPIFVSILWALLRKRVPPSVIADLEIMPANITDSFTQINDSLWKLCGPDAGKATLDIVFFPGLQLGAFDQSFWKTWLVRGSQNEIWPKKWLSKMDCFSQARMLLVSYNSIARNERELNMYTLGENLVADVIYGKANVGQDCPVILVGHCVGGLIIKQLVLSANDRILRRRGIWPRGLHALPEKMERRGLHAFPEEIERIDKFLSNIRGLYYYGTPHDGSALADLGRELLPRASPILRFLEEIKLSTIINDNFRSDFKIPAAAMCEGLTTAYGDFFEDIVVPPASAAHGMDDFYTDTTANHFDVSKAEGPDSPVIEKLTQFISKCLSSGLSSQVFSR